MARRLFSLSRHSADPAFLFELVERGIQRSVAHLQHVLGNLLEALPNRPRVERFEREDLEDQKVERALQEVGRLTHGYRGEHTSSPLGNQGEPSS